jgi:hypothetical protein
VKTRIGWISKEYDPLIINVNGELFIQGVFSKKGKKEEYAPEDWPPRKVKVTIEEVK